MMLYYYYYYSPARESTLKFKEQLVEEQKVQALKIGKRRLVLFGIGVQWKHSSHWCHAEAGRQRAT